MSKKPTRAPKGLKGGTLKKDDGEKIKWTGHLDTEATPSISDEELARAKTIFFQNDKDENGSIDRSELQWMLKELGQNPTDEMLDQMMVRRASAIRRNSSLRLLVPHPAIHPRRNKPTAAPWAATTTAGSTCASSCGGTRAG